MRKLEARPRSRVGPLALLALGTSACAGGGGGVPPHMHGSRLVCSAPHVDACAGSLSAAGESLRGLWRPVIDGYEVPDESIYFDGCRVFMPPQLGSSWTHVDGCLQPSSESVGVPAYVDARDRLIYSPCGEVLFVGTVNVDSMVVERSEPGGGVVRVADYVRVASDSATDLEAARAGACLRYCVRGVPQWFSQVGVDLMRDTLRRVDRPTYVDAILSSGSEDARLVWALIVAGYSARPHTELGELVEVLDAGQEFGWSEVVASETFDRWPAVFRAREALRERDLIRRHVEFADDGC